MVTLYLPLFSQIDMDTLTLHHHSTPHGTYGYIESKLGSRFETLETPHSIIPDGTYKVILTYSPKFHRMLPLFTGIKGHDGVRIHVGNFVEDTVGCVLIGSRTSASLKTLYPRAETACRRSEQEKTTLSLIHSVRTLNTFMKLFSFPLIIKVVSF